MALSISKALKEEATDHPLAENARVLTAELAWLSAVIEVRVALHFGHEVPYQDIADLPVPDISASTGAYKDLAAYEETQREGKTVLIPIVELDNSDNGERVTLAWNGAANAQYTISYPDPEEPSKVKSIAIPEGQRSWTPDDIHDTTTFLLQATAGQGEEQVRLISARL